MKNILVFLFCAVLFTACGKFEGDLSPVTPSGFRWNLNGSVSHDTVYYNVDQVVLAEILDDAGQKVSAEFNFGNSNLPVFGNQAADKYTKEGVYKLTASIKTSMPLIKLTITVIVKKASVYSLKINDQKMEDGATFKTTEGALLNFRVQNSDGKNFVVAFDFGDGDKIATDSIKKAYKTAGSYKLTAALSGKTLTATIEVTKVATESIMLISSSVSGSNITAVLGLRCSDIYQVSLTKDTYVAGEIPGTNWKNYKLAETTTIGGADYFKWTVTAPAGKFRLGWVQMKTGGTDLYKDGNWSYNFSSVYFSNNDGLFIFYLKVENGVVKLATN